jgi:hypothetical protein
VLQRLLDSEQAALRFWGAQGLTLRGSDAVKNHASKLYAMLQDPSRAARTAAAEALAHHGSDEQKTAAIATLFENADPGKESTIAATEALNALDHLGLEALKPHVAALAALPTAGNANDPARIKEYAARVHEYLRPLLGYTSAANAPKGDKPKRKANKKP